MPIEKRDPNSKARLFIPTTREKSVIANQRLLKKELEEVARMKQDLQTMMDELKEKE